MRYRIIDLQDKSMGQAKRIMKRLLHKKRKGKGTPWIRRKIKTPLRFLLPSKERKSHKMFQPEKIKSTCPYCGSRLVETEVGVVCSSENMRYIAHDIISTIRRHGEEKAEMFMSKKANRFYDYYKAEGVIMTCDYVLGNEEKRFRINNRLLRPGVDRKKIFGGKK